MFIIEREAHVTFAEIVRYYREIPDLMVLESQRDGRYSFLFRDAFLTLSAKGRQNHLRYRDGRELVREGDPLGVLEELLATYHRTDMPPDLPLVSGAVGALGYGLRHAIAELPRIDKPDLGLPDLFFRFYEGVLLYDHETGRIVLTDGDHFPGGEERLSAWAEEISRITPSPFSLPDVRAPLPVRRNMTKAQYLEAIERVLRHIKDGDVYQINYTQRLCCPYTGDPNRLYEIMRAINPAPFAALIRGEDFDLVSASPERFLRLRGMELETKPIKGTRPRSDRPEEDERLKKELEGSEKDRSELLMIVDLERNDFSRVAQVGSVRVPELFEIESYATVHHLVSKVVAKKEESLGPVDVIRATFPGGSITGAPKISAMTIIDRLEPTPRDFYTGSIGYIDFSGESMDLNIVIRTILFRDGEAYCHVGGGIVYDSDPAFEYDECDVKAKALLEALSRGAS